LIRETAHPEANIIFGAVIDEGMVDQIRITVVATGFDTTAMPPRIQRAQVQTRPATTATAPVQSQPQPQQQAPARTRQPERTRLEIQVPQFAGGDELDIPPFLRNR
ncbi:MAG: cell division protein FtsZ, partial [Anaerolineae bacterium]|nr:cell division protein FtsZ [Anaerolineae bacterium]